MADKKVTELDELVAVPPGKNADVWILVAFNGISYKVRLSVLLAATP